MPRRQTVAVKSKFKVGTYLAPFIIPATIGFSTFLTPYITALFTSLFAAHAPVLAAGMGIAFSVLIGILVGITACFLLSTIIQRLHYGTEFDRKMAADTQENVEKEQKHFVERYFSLRNGEGEENTDKSSVVPQKEGEENTDKSSVVPQKQGEENTDKSSVVPQKKGEENREQNNIAPGNSHENALSRVKNVNGNNETTTLPETLINFIDESIELGRVEKEATDQNADLQHSLPYCRFKEEKAREKFYNALLYYNYKKVPYSFFGDQGNLFWHLNAWMSSPSDYNELENYFKNCPLPEAHHPAACT